MGEKTIAKLVTILSYLLRFQLRHTVSFVPMAFSILSRKINMQISIEANIAFGHTCVNPGISSRGKYWNSSFAHCKWHQKQSCANLYERKVIYIEDCWMSPLFSSPESTRVPVDSKRCEGRSRDCMTAYKETLYRDTSSLASEIYLCGTC